MGIYLIKNLKNNKIYVGSSLKYFMVKASIKGAVKKKLKK